MKRIILLILALMTVKTGSAQQYPVNYNFINDYKYVYLKVESTLGYQKKKITSLIYKYLKQREIPVYHDSTEIPQGAIAREILKLEITSTWRVMQITQKVNFSSQNKTLFTQVYYKPIFRIMEPFSRPHFKAFKKYNPQLKQFKYQYKP